MSGFFSPILRKAPLVRMAFALTFGTVSQQIFLAKAQKKPWPDQDLNQKILSPGLELHHHYDAMIFAISRNPAALSREEVQSLAHRLATQDPDINDRISRARLFNELVETYPEILTVDEISRVLAQKKSSIFLVHLNLLRETPGFVLAKNLQPLFSLTPETVLLVQEQEATKSELPFLNSHTGKEVRIRVIDTDKDFYESYP